MMTYVLKKIGKIISRICGNFLPPKIHYHNVSTIPNERFENVPLETRRCKESPTT